MKMNIHAKTLAALFAALGLAAAVLPAQDNYRELGSAAAEKTPAKKARPAVQSRKGATTERLSFSDKTRPGTLKINMAFAEIDIRGTSGGEVVVSSSLGKKNGAQIDADGFRRLDQETAFELVEENNIATLRIAGGNQWTASDAEFKILVPRSTNLVIKTQSGGGVEIDDIDGDIEVSTVNSEIDIENVSGSVVANTISGKIEAEFKSAPQKPVSLTAMNGSIELSLPAAAAANLRMRTMNGTIRTNFPENALKTTATADGRTARPAATVVVSDSRAILASGSSAPTDGELVQTIIETRKAQALDYADKGLAAAQKGMAAAMNVIDDIKGLSDEEKELIKRKLQSSADAIPRTSRGANMPSVGGKTITGELNGGGVDIQLTTMNGNITLKREK